MTYSEFMNSLNKNHHDIENPILRALRYDAIGDWSSAHQIVDGMQGNDAAWIHAYLHRKEGDIWNADYWYRRANRTRPPCSLSAEWKSLIKHFTIQH